ncbi:hypothetical protein EC968_009963 [Mortierella alpina]|nr:hypothetical protein EC968_009963 [Mortierella alpina]
MVMMLETSPLTLPELTMLIGQFLHRNDICACIRVSKTWQRNYEPLLYRSLYLDDHTMRKLTKDRILQHINHIRHLTLVEPMHLTVGALQRPILPGAASEPLLPSKSATPLPPTPSGASSDEQAVEPGPPSSTTCRNLLSIDINPSMLFRKLVHEQIPKQKILAVGTDSYNMLEDDFWCLQSTDACIQLLRTNPSLRSLSETWDNMSSLHRIRFTQLLCREPNMLVKMHLTKWEVYPEELNLLTENSPCLEHLRFSTLVVKRHAETPATVPTLPVSTARPVLNLGRLKVLILTYATIMVNRLQIEAPELQTLCITMSHVDLNPSSVTLSSSSSFAHYASSATSLAGYHPHPPVSWNTPRLEKLVFNRSDHRFGTATLLESAYALRAISFADYEVDSRLVEDILARQASQIERIRLACYVGMAAKDIRSILTRCPNLKTLYAPEILVWAGDLIPKVAMNHGEPQYVCQQGYQQPQPQEHYLPRSQDQDHWVCSRLEMLSVYVCLEPIAALEEPAYMQTHHPYASMQVHQSQLTAYPGRVIRKARGLSKVAEEQSRKERSLRVREGLFRELARLTQLRHLDLSGGRVEKMDHVQLGLPMTLRGGLHSLAALTKLEHVAISDWMDEMGREELGWMKRFWPRLRFLSLLKTEPATTTRLQAMAGEMWPELVVQDKEWNKGGACPWTFFGL